MREKNGPVSPVFSQTAALTLPDLKAVAGVESPHHEVKDDRQHGRPKHLQASKMFRTWYVVIELLEEPPWAMESA